VKLHEGDTAVEIGSAPGGASYALLQRGKGSIMFPSKIGLKDLCK
jgi:23S rRNA C2498 (ribose-2'-O)-methylase RlmM